MNTFSATSPVMQHRRILLCGDHGSGKTVLGLQFPKLGVIEIDKNLRGPFEHVLRLNPSLSFKCESPYKKSDTEDYPISEVWPRIEQAIVAFSKDPDVNTVLFDGLTMMDGMLAEHILKEQHVKDLRQNDWGIFHKYTLRLLTACRSLNKTFIMICHEKPVYNASELIERYIPNFRSRVGWHFGGFFTDVWRAYTVPCSRDATHPTGVKFCLETTPTALRQLKNSCGIPGTIEDVTYGKLEQYLK